ncbi:MAG: hypothetical protein GX767_03450 [Firmicutes bacterium]|nr:hypothetical protein [Bacillota bacterium]
MKYFLKIIREEKGSVLVTITLAMVALLGVTALVVDAGLAYAERVKLNNAVDAAALAGVQEMASGLDVSLTEEAARDYALLNAPDLDENLLSIQVNKEENRVVVSARKVMGLFFARVLNFFEADIGARAVASFRYPTQVTQVKNGNVLPLFISQEVYEGTLNEDGSINEDLQINLMGSDNFHVIIDGREVPGNWGALNFEHGTSSFVAALEGSLETVINMEAGSWYEQGTKTGTMGVNVKKAVDKRLAEGSSVPSYGLIPIVDAVEDKGGGKVAVHICGFAIFNITGTRHDPPGWTIEGHLKNGTSIPDFNGSTSEEETYNYGARVLTLVE